MFRTGLQQVTHVMEFVDLASYSRHLEKRRMDSVMLVDADITRHTLF